MRPLFFYLPLFSVIAIYMARLAELGKKRDLAAGKIHEDLALRLFMLAGTAIFVASIVEYIWRGGQINWPLFALGWVCGIASFWIRRKAIAALGRYWSFHVEIRESHEFVRSGPFKVVRHPAYLSMVLELLALALICNALFTIFLIPLLFVPVLIMRVRLEEAALLEKFGAAYHEYQRQTPALFPWKW